MQPDVFAAGGYSFFRRGGYPEVTHRTFLRTIDRYLTSLVFAF